MIDVGSPAVAAADLLRDRGPGRRTPRRFVVPIEVLAGVFFVLIALLFVGLGQEMGRAFDAIENRVVGLHGRTSWAAWPGSWPSAWSSYFRARR